MRCKDKIRPRQTDFQVHRVDLRAKTADTKEKEEETNSKGTKEEVNKREREREKSQS